MIFRFTEPDDHGWQSVSGGTPESGNLPPGYPGDAGATNSKIPALNGSRVFQTLK
jgi:hypothetical protein